MTESIQDVNIELGDEISKMLYEASRLTHENRPGLLTEFHESFSGARAISIGKISDPDNVYMNLGFDGVGTKVEVAERTEDHSTVAFDLFAMVCDDAVVRGAEPIAIGSILDVRQLHDTEIIRGNIRQLALGYIAAARAANVVVVNGEVAELGNRIKGYQRIDGLNPFQAFMQRVKNRISGEKADGLNYNWGAAVLWLAHKDKLLTGHQLRSGDTLVGLAERGFRSNGITDVRKAMRKEYGRKWHEQKEPSVSQESLGVVVQTPSIIYSGLVMALTGGYDKEPKAEITGVAHITGGGQPSKLGRMLEPSGLGAVIDDPIAPPEIMTHVQELRGFNDEKAYSKWHMGPGMIIATSEPDKVVAEAKDHDVDARVIGYIKDEPGIKIKNRGAQQKEEWLEF